MIGIPGLSISRRRRRASFTGAYDAVPSIVAAYGMRRLRTAYTGSLLRMRRSSDNAESDFGYTAAGHLDTAAIVAWLSGSGYIVTWYDQSGNGYNATQTAQAARQPLYVASGQNGRPVLRFDGVNDSLQAGFSTISQPWSAVAACSSTANNAHVLNSYSITNSAIYRNSSGALALYCGMTLVSSTISGFHVASAIANGASSTLAYNGSSSTGNAGSGALANGITIGSLHMASSFLNGDIAELIICNAALSTGDRQTGESAAANYWGITLS